MWQIKGWVQDIQSSARGLSLCQWNIRVCWGLRLMFGCTVGGPFLWSSCMDLLIDCCCGTNKGISNPPPNVIVLHSVWVLFHHTCDVAVVSSHGEARMWQKWQRGHFCRCKLADVSGLFNLHLSWVCHINRNVCRQALSPSSFPNLFTCSTVHVLSFTLASCLSLCPVSEGKYQLILKKMN